MKKIEVNIPEEKLTGIEKSPTGKTYRKTRGKTKRYSINYSRVFGIKKILKVKFKCIHFEKIYETELDAINCCRRRKIKYGN